MNDNYRAQSVLKKDEVLKLLAEHLRDSKSTTIDSMRSFVENYLKEKGVIGEITEGNSMMRTTYNRRISDGDALLINECIYDLLYSRTITPGMNASNLELPFVHLSNEDKLNDYL